MADKRDEILGDEFEGGSTEFFAKNAGAITVLLGCIMAGMIGWYGYRGWTSSAKEEATASYYEAVSKYEDGIAAGDDEAKRRELLIAAASKAESIADAAKGPMALKARLIAGNSHYYLGLTQKGEDFSASFKAARANFDKYIASAQTPEEKAVGHLALGNTLENLLLLTNDLTLGVDCGNAYKEVSRVAKGTALDYDARLGLARLLLVQEGKQDEAKAVLQSIVADSAKSSTDDLTAKLRKGETLTTFSIVEKNGPRRDIGVEELAKIRDMKSLSYAKLAEDMLQRIPALPRKLSSETTGTATNG